MFKKKMSIYNKEKNIKEDLKDFKMSVKKNPKEIFLDQLKKISKEFEIETGCEVKSIEFHRILTYNMSNLQETVFGHISLTLK
jgi:hypothetical protein